MKCLHIITGLSIGGAEKALFNILENGLSTRYENHIITLISDGALAQPIRDLGIPVISLDMKQGRISLRAVSKLRSVINKLQPDLIQGWMYHGNLVATIAAELCSNSPILVWNIRQTLYSIKNEKYLTQCVIRANRLLSKRPTAILYNSHLSRIQHESFGYFSKYGKVISNGIDIKKFHPNSITKMAVRNELGIPQNAIVIGHVARFHVMKDHRNFLQAAQLLAENHENVHFLMIGKHITNENEYLAPLITKNLLCKMHMLGEHQNITRLMMTMDIFCMSSAWGEAFPNVIGEAMASGVPCVTTDVGESASIVDNTGTIIPPKNNSALYAGIEGMLSMSEDKRNILGNAARQRIIENYSIKSIVNIYMEFYTELFNKKQSLCKNS